MQSFRSRLLQCGSAMGSQVLQAHLLQQSPLSMGHISYKEPALARGLPMASQPPLGFHQLLCSILHGIQINLCSTVDFQRLQGHSCLTVIFTTGSRGMSATAPGTPPFPTFTDPDVCSFVFHIFSLFSLATAAANFWSFSSTLFHRCYYHH